MKKLELQDSINTHLPKREVNQRIMDFIIQNQIKLKEMNDNIVTGMYGSRLKAHTRGMLADPSILPVKITIKLKTKGKGTELNVYMKEGYVGIPPLGMNKKYPQLFARLMNNLKLHFYRNNYQKEEKNKCNNCSIQIVDKKQRFCEMCGYELLKI